LQYSLVRLDKGAFVHGKLIEGVGYMWISKELKLLKITKWFFYLLLWRPLATVLEESTKVEICRFSENWNIKKKVCLMRNVLFDISYLVLVY
jgi:hypothetical protein